MRDRSHGTERLAPVRRLAWWLVYAYPPRFRHDVGLGLADAIEDFMRARQARGASAPRVWFDAIVDTARNAPAEWISWSASLSGERSAARLEASRSGTQKRTTMDMLQQDIRYALRLWRRRPAFALVAILTLSLGVGANTAMFSIVNAVLLRPLPYKDADRLTAVWVRTPTTPRSLVSYDEYRAFTGQRDAFDAVGLWRGQSVNLTAVDEPRRIVGNYISGSFFDVLQLTAARGRLFTEADSVPGSAQPVVVISELFWERQFNRDPAAIGKTLALDGSVLTVIGVLASPFDLTHAPVGDTFINYDVFIPVGLFPVPSNVPRAALNAAPSMVAIARLKPGVAVEGASAGLQTVSARLEAANPAAQKGRTAFALSSHEDLVGASRTPLVLLLASVGCVLLIGCLNVSNLLLARAMDRQREMALRSALGASGAAVIRQLAIEAALLAAVSGGIGLVAGRWVLQALVSLRPPGVSLPDAIPLDGTVLLFTFGAAVVVALVCGVAPAARATRLDLSRVLQSGRRAGGAGRAVRDAFVVAEIALCVALMAVSGLLIQSLLAVQSVNVGYDARSAFTLQLRLPATKYKSPEEIARFFQQAIGRIREVPGVESAAFVRRVPMSGNWGDTPYVPDGQTIAKGSEPRASQNIVTPDYFKAMRISMMRGRDFTDRDDLTAPPVVVINETMARTVWPGEDPVGKRLTVPEYPQPATVVGVVGDVKHRTPTEPAQPQIYLAHYQSPMIFSSLVARTSVPPLTLTGEIRRAVWSVDKDQPMWSIAALDGILTGSHGSARFMATLLTTFAGVALLLAAVGIYGVMSYSVTERTREIGIRIALGATTERVRRDVVLRGLWLTAIAVAIGVAGAAGLGRFVRGLLFGVTPGDPATLAGAAVLLAVVSLAACYIPARRASRVDPVVALAEE